MNIALDLILGPSMLIAKYDPVGSTLGMGSLLSPSSHDFFIMTPVIFVIGKL